MVTNNNVHHNTAMRTPQFYLVWAAVAGNAIAGVTVMTAAKTLISDFGKALRRSCFPLRIGTVHRIKRLRVPGAVVPSIVTGGFAASYVAALSGVNMLGRFGWAAASDFLGRKTTYAVFGLGIPILAALPSITDYMIQQ